MRVQLKCARDVLRRSLSLSLSLSLSRHVCHGRACNNARRGYLARIFMPLAILRERPENTRADWRSQGGNAYPPRTQERKRERERERERETARLTEIREKVIGSRSDLFYCQMMKELEMRIRPYREFANDTASVRCSKYRPAHDEISKVFRNNLN